MKIDSKFDLSQTVYLNKTGAEVMVEKIILEYLNNACGVIYVCHDSEGHTYHHKEDELTAEKPKLKTIYELDSDDEYYYISENGNIKFREFYNDDFQRRLFACGNVFVTREEAEKDIEHRKVHQELKRMSNGYKYNPDCRNYYLAYCNSLRATVTMLTESYYCPGTVYFASEKEAIEAARQIGEERLKKDYFDVC